MSDPDEPQSFAWWVRDPNLIAREKWVRCDLPGVQEDVGHGCLERYDRKDHPQDHRLIGCRWVFKVKRSGVYHAILVAKGFRQIPGMDFTDIYFPVVNNVTFRVVVSSLSKC